ncbi:hypothetical protein [Kitasatospora atroaurantiaca]
MTSTGSARRRAMTRLLTRTTSSAAVALALLTVPYGATVPPAAAVSAAVATPRTGPQLAASWTGPLSTRGRYVVDAGGNRFKLKAGNWAGAQGTWEGSGDVNDPANNQAGQVSHNMPLGLDRASLCATSREFS